MVVLLHDRHFTTWLSFILTVLPNYCEQVWCYTICQQFVHCFQVSLLCLISLQYYCILLIFHLHCSRWCRFTFLTHVVRKCQCCWRGNWMSCVIISLSIINPHTWLAWQWCYFLLTSYGRKCAMYYLYQIMLNWKLLHKFEEWCKFSSCIEAKSCKKNFHNTRPPFTMFSWNMLNHSPPWHTIRSRRVEPCY